MGMIKDQPEALPSTDALNPTPGVQGALIESAWVKFAGTSHIALEDPPELDEPRTYIVKATCKKVETTLRKDNEERHAVVMEIDSIYERGKVPIVDDKQPTLFDGQDPDADDEGVDGDGSDDESDAEVEEHEVDRPGFSDAE